MSIVERYILRELFATIFLFLFCFFSLYILIDYATHARTFHHGSTGFALQELAAYYFAELVRRLDILLPFALMIATIRTLCKMNRANELVALLAGGVSMGKILRPFLFTALLGTTFLFAVEELALPGAFETLREKGSVRAAKKYRTESVKNIALQDGTTLLFQSYDGQTKEFSDVWWIESPQKLWRMQTFSIKDNLGKEIEEFVRNTDGALLLASQNPTKIFALQVNENRLWETVSVPEELSFSNLYSQLGGKSQNERTALVTTAFVQKLVFPWMAAFAVIIPIPYCIRFGRRLPQFMIFAGSLFALEALFLLLDAGVVLAERQTLSPLLSLCCPIGLAGVITFLTGYKKL